MELPAFADNFARAAFTVYFNPKALKKPENIIKLFYKVSIRKIKKRINNAFMVKNLQRYLLSITYVMWLEYFNNHLKNFFIDFFVQLLFLNKGSSMFFPSENCEVCGSVYFLEHFSFAQLT